MGDELDCPMRSGVHSSRGRFVFGSDFAWFFVQLCLIVSSQGLKIWFALQVFFVSLVAPWGSPSAYLSIPGDHSSRSAFWLLLGNSVCLVLQVGAQSISRLSLRVGMLL